MTSSSSQDDPMSRRTWVEAATTALASGGIDAVKVESLAKMLAVTKGSFYWHFSDRQDLHEAVLEMWEELGTSQIIELVDAGGADDPTARLRRLMRVVSRADGNAARIETAIRSWAAADDVAARTIERVDGRRLDFVVALLRSLGHSPATARRRSRLLYRAMIGDFLWRATGGPATSPSDVDDMVDLLTRTDAR